MRNFFKNTKVNYDTGWSIENKEVCGDFLHNRTGAQEFRIKVFCSLKPFFSFCNYMNKISNVRLFSWALSIVQRCNLSNDISTDDKLYRQWIFRFLCILKVKFVFLWIDVALWMNKVVGHRSVCQLSYSLL